MQTWNRSSDRVFIVAFHGFISGGENPIGYFAEQQAKSIAIHLPQLLTEVTDIAYRVFIARDGRDSPLKYTRFRAWAKH